MTDNSTTPENSMQRAWQEGYDEGFNGTTPTTPEPYNHAQASVAERYGLEKLLAVAAREHAENGDILSYQAVLNLIATLTNRPAPAHDTEAKIAYIVDILERGNHVAEWPADEATAYRKHRFKEGNDAVNRLRAQKIIAFLND